MQHRSGRGPPTQIYCRSRDSRNGRAIGSSLGDGSCRCLAIAHFLSRHDRCSGILSGIAKVLCKYGLLGVFNVGPGLDEAERVPSVDSRLRRSSRIPLDDGAIAFDGRDRRCCSLSHAVLISDMTCCHASSVGSAAARFRAIGPTSKLAALCCVGSSTAAKNRTSRDSRDAMGRPLWKRIRLPRVAGTRGCRVIMPMRLSGSVAERTCQPSAGATSAQTSQSLDGITACKLLAADTRNKPSAAHFTAHLPTTIDADQLAPWRSEAFSRKQIAEHHAIAFQQESPPALCVHVRRKSRGKWREL